MNGISIAHTTSSSQPLTEAPSAAWTAACNPPSRNCPCPLFPPTLWSHLEMKIPHQPWHLPWWNSQLRPNFSSSVGNLATNLDASSAISRFFGHQRGNSSPFLNPIRSPLKSHHVWWLKPLVPAISAGQISLDPVAVNASLSENSVPLHPMVNDHYPY